MNGPTVPTEPAGEGPIAASAAPSPAMAPPPSPGPVPTSSPASACPPPSPAAGETDAERVARYHDLLQTSSSILAGFSLTGLIGLPEVGPDGVARVAAALFLEPSLYAFPIIYIAMFFATVSFLGVLISIVSFRLQAGRASPSFLLTSFRLSVLVFAMGIANLLVATMTLGVPTTRGAAVGALAAAAFVYMMLRRAFFLQGDR